MSRILRVLLAVTIVAGVGVIAVLAQGGDAWSCDEFIYAHGDAVSGYETENEAILAGVDQLPTLGLSKDQADAAREAVLSTDGADRYVDGKLYLQDQLVAEFPAEELSDGTFIVSSWKACAPPAEDGEPTPSEASE
jgi:hypothetical protein